MALFSKAGSHSLSLTWTQPDPESHLMLALRSGWEKVKVINTKRLLKGDILMDSLSLGDHPCPSQNKYGNASVVLGSSFGVKQHHSKRAIELDSL